MKGIIFVQTIGSRENARVTKHAELTALNSERIRKSKCGWRAGWEEEAGASER